MMVAALQILAERGVLLGGLLGRRRLLAGRLLRLRHLSVLQLWQPILSQLPGQPHGLLMRYCCSMAVQEGPFSVCTKTQRSLGLSHLLKAMLPVWIAAAAFRMLCVHINKCEHHGDKSSKGTFAGHVLTLYVCHAVL